MKEVKKNIIDVYKSILITEIIKETFNRTNKSGRKRIFTIEYYIDYILFVFVNGVPWNALNTIPGTKCNWKSIKKQFYRWNSLKIFDRVHTKLLKFYIRYSAPITFTYIDSTDVRNINALKKNVSYGRKHKGKFAIKIHALTDDNFIMHSMIFTKSREKDEQHIIPVINNIYVPLGNTYRKPLYVCGDKGYVFNRVKKQLRSQNIILTYPYKKNQLKRNRGKNLVILNNRHRIESAFGQIKRGYKRTSNLLDRNIGTYNTWWIMANTCQIIKCPTFIDPYILHLESMK
jgi:transposase